MTEFFDFIFVLSLVDFPPMVGAFMGSNNYMWSRLDRFLVSLEWEFHFPNVCQKRLPHLVLILATIL